MTVSVCHRGGGGPLGACIATGTGVTVEREHGGAFVPCLGVFAVKTLAHRTVTLLHC